VPPAALLAFEHARELLHSEELSAGRCSTMKNYVPYRHSCATASRLINYEHLGKGSNTVPNLTSASSPFDAEFHHLPRSRFINGECCPFGFSFDSCNQIPVDAPILG
jgi:hypothetical protein